MFGIMQYYASPNSDHCMKLGNVKRSGSVCGRVAGSCQLQEALILLMLLDAHPGVVTHARIANLHARLLRVLELLLLARRRLVLVNVLGCFTIGAFPLELGHHNLVRGPGVDSRGEKTVHLLERNVLGLGEKELVF